MVEAQKKNLNIFRYSKLWWDEYRFWWFFC